MLTIPFSHVKRLYTQQKHQPFPSIGIEPRAAYTSRKGTTFITRNSHHTVWFQSADGELHEISKHATRSQAVKAMKLLHA
jgi:hypothetical protein